MANYANQLTIKLDVDKTVRKVGDNGEAFAPWVLWKYKKAAEVSDTFAAFLLINSYLIF